MTNTNNTDVNKISIQKVVYQHEMNTNMNMKSMIY